VQVSPDVHVVFFPQTHITCIDRRFQSTTHPAHHCVDPNAMARTKKTTRKHPPKKDPPKKLKVLFCGMEFEEGWNQTRLAVERSYLSNTVDIVRCARADVPTEIVDADLVVPLMTKLDATTLDKATRLAMVLQFGVGLEGVDQDACTARGIVLARIPSEHTGNAHATAEMAVYLTLAATRRVNQMRESVEGTILGSPMGKTLHGKNVLIVGWGNVGQKIATLLRPFGCRLSAARRTSWCDRTTGSTSKTETEKCLEHKYKGSVPDKLQGVPDADIVILACTQTAENKGMIDCKFLSRMKQGAAIVNVARGGLFNPSDCVDALESGQLGYLASDVAWEEPVDPKHKLCAHKNAYFTPHVGGVTDVSYGCMGNCVKEVAEAMVERRGYPTQEEWSEQAECETVRWNGTVVRCVNVPQLEVRFPQWHFLSGPKNNYQPDPGESLRPSKEFEEFPPVGGEKKRARTK
jgi:phosphoglycerate dehydrogenase-like enzyme